MGVHAKPINKTLENLIIEHYANSTLRELKKICADAGFDLPRKTMRNVCNRYGLIKTKEAFPRKREYEKIEPNISTGNHVERQGNRLIHRMC